MMLRHIVGFSREEIQNCDACQEHCFDAAYALDPDGSYEDLNDRALDMLIEQEHLCPAHA